MGFRETVQATHGAARLAGHDGRAALLGQRRRLVQLRWVVGCCRGEAALLVGPCRCYRCRCVATGVGGVRPRRGQQLVASHRRPALRSQAAEVLLARGQKSLRAERRKLWNKIACCCRRGAPAQAIAAEGLLRALGLTLPQPEQRGPWSKTACRFHLGCALALAIAAVPAAAENRLDHRQHGQQLLTGLTMSRGRLSARWRGHHPWHRWASLTLLRGVCCAQSNLLEVSFFFFWFRLFCSKIFYTPLFFYLLGVLSVH